LRTAHGETARRRTRRHYAEETIMILVKTEAGQQVLKDRSVPLSPRQRTAFILFDGKRSVDEVLAGTGIAREEIDQLVTLGLLGPVAGSKPAAPAKASEPPATSRAPAAATPSATPPPAPTPKPAESAPSAARSRQQRYKDAYPIATQLTGALGLKGFRLNLQVEGTTSYEDLAALAPKIRAAVGPEKAAALDKALND
jgi:pyruvate/2-oxoglutarate dehydrogenase complex dihydrolipoamide acyltransferase (E2) component